MGSLCYSPQGAKARNNEEKLLLRSRILICFSFGLDFCPFDDIWRNDQTPLEAVDELNHTGQIEAFHSKSMAYNLNT